ncbi:vacuolar protein-sorting-associated protein 25 [Bacillus rossius redtenbacheri]|uniref:vacuolar protein-sorting-associated protein 25 n=1 Tax=Bacillus rossius redtenbacheri TaxID=93214 RepID=UPI002FDCDDDF
MSSIEWPWQYSFPPFFTIQPHAETRAKQIQAWRSLVLDYHRSVKQSVLDVREAERSPLFNNTAINRQLPRDGILAVLEDLAKTKNAEPLDKSKNRWYVYWHTLEEWGDAVYEWARGAGLLNAVCTLFELTQGDDTSGQEFHGLDSEVMVKALTTLANKNKAELIMFDDNQGVKFF